MVAVLPVVVVPLVVAAVAVPPALVVEATLAPVVPPAPELVDAALTEIALADVDVALELVAPVTVVLDVAAVDEVCPEVPPALVLPLSAPVSLAPFEPSLQAETTTGANESSKPRHRDFMSNAPRTKINHGVAGSKLRHDAQRFRRLPNTHATKIRRPVGLTNMEGFLARSHVLGDVSPGRYKNVRRSVPEMTGLRAWHLGTSMQRAIGVAVARMPRHPTDSERF